MTPQQILETPDLIAVGSAGDEVRRQMRGLRTTFVRVLETHVDAPLSAMPAGAEPGEVRLLGVPASLEAAVAAVRSVVSAAGEVPVTGFTVADLRDLGPLDVVARDLRDAGLAAIAQLPIDLVPDAETAARTIFAAGLPIHALTVHQLDDARRLDLCERALRLQAAAGGFKAFAPLPRTLSVTKPTTGYDDVKLVSLARVVVSNIPSIQVDWQLYGPKMAQVALTVGADDVDNVSAAGSGVLGTRRSPLEEIRRNITAAALEPAERDGLFRPRT